jgi:hypothetical protein
MAELRCGACCLPRTQTPGGLGTPLYGHNDPCARSSLNGLGFGSGTQTRPGDRAVRLEPRTKTPLWTVRREAAALQQ